jgi:hypothetical protein
MIALSLSIVHRNDKRIEEYFSLAIENYIQCGDLQRATRLALWAYEVYKSSRSTNAAQFLLAVAEKEQSSNAAVLYEQAGLVFFYSRPIYRRKYAFYSVLAGQNFQKSNKVRTNILFDFKTEICFYSLLMRVDVLKRLLGLSRIRTGLLLKIVLA